MDRVKDVPEEGQNIHGLFIEGGKWNRQEGKLDESLRSANPIIEF